jgi:aminopeptidase N
MLRFALVAGALWLAGCRPGAVQSQPNPFDSGGVLSPEQAAYDVTFYDLTLRVNPADSTIAGTLTATARITAPLAWFVLDLEPSLTVTEVAWVTGPRQQEKAHFERKGGQLRVQFLMMKQPGEVVTLAVTYGGRPHVARNPPWDGGFTWKTTPSGQPWVATTCQTEGADLWWPVKDHVSDEPDSMALHITVPHPLVVASNGRLQAVEPRPNGWQTFHWHISVPINTYNVALNIAPYRTLETTFRSVADEDVPFQFFVLPENEADGQRILPEFLDHLRFYEELLGPYPFRADKYGVAQTPHLGMEHQSIIAYGARFNNGSMTGGKDWGFDALHHHELAHEWWGNLVTNASWEDMWLHEGFGSYMQPLYLEQRYGIARYHEYLQSVRRSISNRQAVAPRETLSSEGIYGGDIYFKGAWVLHSLRYLIGDEQLFQSLRRMAYPDPAMEQVSDGRQARFATTDDYVHLVSTLTGQDLGWFFEVYVRQPALPRLVMTRDGTQVQLAWETPHNLPFPMPVDVSVEGTVRRVEMPEGRAQLTVPENASVVVDPHHWVLRAE